MNEPRITLEDKGNHAYIVVTTHTGTQVPFICAEPEIKMALDLLRKESMRFRLWKGVVQQVLFDAKGKELAKAAFLAGFECRKSGYEHHENGFQDWLGDLTELIQ